MGHVIVLVVLVAVGGRYALDVELIVLTAREEHLFAADDLTRLDQATGGTFNIKSVLEIANYGRFAAGYVSFDGDLNLIL
jgi:hypothetical protein